MVSKTEIDDYITKNHKEIKNFIKKNYIINGVYDESEDIFFSHLYLFLLGKDINDEQHLKYLISNFIHYNTRWEKSSVKREMKYKVTEEFDEFQHNKIDDSENDIINKIDNEIDLTNYKTICELYYQSLTDLEKKVVYQIYFDEGHSSIRKFANYANISKWNAECYINQMKKEIKDFYEKLRQKQE